MDTAPTATASRESPDAADARLAARRRRTPAPGWQPAEVLDVIDEAPDAVTLRLGVVPGAGHLPGQYFNVRLTVPDRARPVQRAYSVGSSPFPDASVVDLGVRELAGGLVSPRLVRDLARGDRLEVRGPVGRFTWTEGDGGPLLLVGAGSGVVPLVAIARYAAAKDLAVPIRLLCSSIDHDHALYREDLAALDRSLPWLEVVHTFTRAPDDGRATYHRRIDRAMLAELLAGHDPAWAYVCGPPAMVDDVTEALGDLGVEPGRVRTERYD